MTNESNTFILDANILIEAHRRYYHFDICPGFWNALLYHHSNAIVFSVDRVYDEIKHGMDNLANWVNSEVPNTFFLNTQEQDTVASYSEMITWASNNTYVHSYAINEFARSADSWLIAHAHANNLTVVTMETSAPLDRKRLRIPDVCEAFNVECIDSFQMLKAIQAKFVMQ
jgi:Domain of unknown function (DUF4411)